jgi:hypothetical protein
MLADLLTRLYASRRSLRRIYAGLILVLVAIPAAVVCWLLVSMLTDSYSVLQQRRLYLGNLLMIADAAKGLDKAEPQPAPGSETIFLEGKNREVISAQLQNWLNSATQDAGAQLQSIENNAGNDDGKRNYVGLTANVYGAWKPIQNVIFRVETAQPVLFVNELEIHSASYGDQDVEAQVSMRISFRGATQVPEAGRRQ